MSDQFLRTAMLYGAEGINKLKNSRVAVFGVGGVGGHCAEALCRSGVGALGLFDGDVVDITNINRQIIATHKTIGRDKVIAMRERLLEINPDTAVEAHKIFYLPQTADDVELSVYDYVVDAMDTITAKLELVCRAGALGIPVISSMGAAGKLDPTALHIADVFETSVCPMARVMRGELRKRGVKALKVVYSKEPPAASELGSQKAGPDPGPGAYSQDSRRGKIQASNAFVPPAAGLIIASEVVKDLLGMATDDRCQWQMKGGRSHTEREMNANEVNAE